jgi:hypothetical protein
MVDIRATSLPQGEMAGKIEVDREKRCRLDNIDVRLKILVVNLQHLS